MRPFPSIDQLIELAEHNPEELEVIRQREIEALISSAPQRLQKRLRGLQFQIDCQRQLHRQSSLGACIAISAMMLDSLQQLNVALQGDEPATRAPEPARVLSFPAADQLASYVQ